MDNFDSAGVRIAYEVHGTGEPVLLIHGFASNIATNWRQTHWIKTLTRAGRRVIAYDNRGHGKSEKLYDPADYGAPEMAKDAVRLLDHLDIGRTDVIGYSMGARIAAFVTIRHPERVRKAVFSGLGVNMVHGVGAPEPIAEALEAERVEDVANPTARGFRIFAQTTRSDLRAMAACIRSAREKITPEALAAITAPVLVAVGEKDVIAGPPEELAKLIPGALSLTIPKRDHMLSVGDEGFKQAVLEFFAQPFADQDT